MVDQLKILICDEDRDYVQALVGFLMSWDASNDSNMSIVYFSEYERFDEAGGFYDIALLGEGFHKHLGSAGERLMARRTLVLSESYGGMTGEFFYKYQSMDALLGLIFTDKRRKSLEQGRDMNRPGKLICIYSPGGHELLLPFALSVCRLLSEESETIFVDMEEQNILSPLTQVETGRDLTDLLYMLENGNVPGEDSFIFAYDGFSVLAPVADPSQLSYVNEEQWKKLFSFIYERGFNRVVVLFGCLIQGFNEMIRDADQFILVSRSGEFGSLMRDVFIRHLDKLEIRRDYAEITIPFSAQNLSRGAYRLDALINGRMLEYVRKELSQRLG